MNIEIERKFLINQLPLKTEETLYIEQYYLSNNKNMVQRLRIFNKKKSIMSFKENNATYVFIAIFTSVLIFYFSDFSAALGKTDKLPIEVAVWMPVVIIFIFSSVGIIHANQK